MCLSGDSPANFPSQVTSDTLPPAHSRPPPSGQVSTLWNNPQAAGLAGVPVSPVPGWEPHRHPGGKGQEGAGDSPGRRPPHPAAGRRQLPARDICAPRRVGVHLPRGHGCPSPVRPGSPACHCPLIGTKQPEEPTHVHTAWKTECSPRPTGWPVGLAGTQWAFLIPYSCVHSALHTPTRTPRPHPCRCGPEASTPEWDIT